MADDDTEAREGNHEEQGAESVDPVPAPIPDEVAAAAGAKFAGTVFVETHGQAVLHVDRAHWHDVASFLRDEEQFTQCLDVCAVDHLVDAAREVPPGVSAERFEVVANFLSHPRNRRIRTICQVPLDEPVVASLVDVYPGVGFAERGT